MKDGTVVVVNNNVRDTVKTLPVVRLTVIIIVVVLLDGTVHFVIKVIFVRISLPLYLKNDK